MSQLLVRLERQFVSAADPSAQAELGARIACELCRVGRFDEAKRKIEDLRQMFGRGENAKVTVWRMLAEGLLHFYSQLSPLALDRITRAQLLAVAMKYKPFVALCSAWKAHIEFELSKFEAMIESLHVSLQNIASDDLDAQTRVAMVLANSYMIAGDRAAAQRWFLRGRDFAVKNGDQASVEALLYNRAAFGFALLRSENCVRELSKEELRLCRMEVESTKNLQMLTGISALNNHIFLCDARLSMLEQEFDIAQRKFEIARQLGPFGEHNFDQSLIDLEIIFCQLHQNYLIECGNKVAKNFDGLDLDEQMYAAWLVSEIARKSPEFARLDDALLRFESLRLRHRSSSNELANLLGRFASALP